jgi:hypothetical protein
VQTYREMGFTTDQIESRLNIFAPMLVGQA